MTLSFFQYLLESSLCLLAFSLFYHLLLVRLTHFTWMRVYLLICIVLSCILPLIDISLQTLQFLFSTNSASTPSLSWNAYDWLTIHYIPEASAEGASANSMSGFVSLLILLYFSGLAYRSWILTQSLLKIRKLIRLNPKVKEGKHWIVYLPDDLPAFSFLNYIFIGKGIEELHTQEVDQIKAHERVHARQKHTLDLLLLELISIVFWFNPIIRYIKNSLQEIHEYLADEAVAGRGEQQKAYAHLLIKLASPMKSIPLATSFSNKQIHNRITMLMKTRTLAQKKFFFLLLLPLMASLLFLLSCIDESQEELKSVASETLTEQNHAEPTLENGKKIASIHWEGNSVYSDEQLSEALDLKPGDFYNEELINSRLNYNPELDDVSSLYMDNGYLFFNININENQVESGNVNLVFDIYEGDQFKTENIIIKGNQSISKEKILSQLKIKSGDWFNRAELIASQKAIAEMGFFDPQNVRINPIPYPEKGTVDIEFVLTEIKAEN